MDDDLLTRIAADADTLANTVAPLLAEAGVASDVVHDAVARAVPLVVEDLHALTERDSAAHADPGYVYECYGSFHALFAHRVAHAVYATGLSSDQDFPVNNRVIYAARRISEAAKVRTGVEIHPAALIGRRMVIDHGWGTVIGEHARIGDDCYLLQNVVLGCRRIGRLTSAGERRHPKVGNRVVMAGNVYIFGPVTVGDDCRIDPGARITSDIPAGTHVRVVSVLQTTRADVGRVQSDPTENYQVTKLPRADRTTLSPGR